MLRNRHLRVAAKRALTSSVSSKPKDDSATINRRLKIKRINKDKPF
ncbi:MAG: hypothetical protein IPQ28_08770 [Sphingobacteriales bacterium]|nr:hypothetical protein [Sphingobacteriales bacterium]